MQAKKTELTEKQPGNGSESGEGLTPCAIASGGNVLKSPGNSGMILCELIPLDRGFFS